MEGEKSHVDIGVRAPGLQKVIVALATLYVCVCGLCSMCPGPSAVLLSVVLILAELIGGARMLDARHPSVPYLVIIWIMTAYTAALVGMRNHHATYFPYRAAVEGRTYRGISPMEKASAHADGGIIQFDETGRLAADQSVGLKLNGHVYCAAPILGADAAAPVQFFAIGEGCCAARGDFQCDDVASARGGIVWHEPIEGPISHRLFAPDSRRSEYTKSALASMVLSNQKMADQPVFLRWVAEPRNLLRTWLTMALLVWIVSSVVFGVLVALLWFVVDFHFDRILRQNVSEALNRDHGHPDPRPPPMDTTAKPQGTSRFSLPWRSAAPQRGLV